MRSVMRDYVGKGCNLELLADSIEEDFQTKKYQTQSAQKDNGWVVQAKREGLLRELLAADRAFTITVVGEPNNFKVSFGIGKWVQNLGIAVIEGVLIWPVVFFAEVPIALWSYEIEKEFWAFVEKEVELKI
ncbi:MAG TPA: hypothetical protein VEC08_03285 [Nitrososphaerales archaeon]|nr:hypothetical protein [Nitrososphaerales archaeon]